eukprot:CAMPEP_0201263782 /NCGR_PEP_ID=MMETSP0853-20130426/7529_1 /ASSEMBLY_ACC=CAM_ASM_000640 /TAXON_ID=183588 /ORGANISM="Pseudo-nitzschia fraudulenta, Strain WWA7" /LENGTH=144 /DNA_ID=CAMNT_0047567489 /DNA_START=628 /DNA_END=1059 /DNA_ORIENTATION=-
MVDRRKDPQAEGPILCSTQKTTITSPRRDRSYAPGVVAIVAPEAFFRERVPCLNGFVPRPRQKGDLVDNGDSRYRPRVAGENPEAGTSLGAPEPGRFVRGTAQKDQAWGDALDREDGPFVATKDPCGVGYGCYRGCCNSGGGAA